jgi:hypothetical protein
MMTQTERQDTLPFEEGITNGEPHRRETQTRAPGEEMK